MTKSKRVFRVGDEGRGNAVSSDVLMTWMMMMMMCLLLVADAVGAAAAATEQNHQRSSSSFAVAFVAAPLPPCSPRPTRRSGYGYISSKNVDTAAVHGLFMGKGFNSAKNKQAALAQKMKLAKQQQQRDVVSPPSEQAHDTEDTPTKKTQLEKEFDRLLSQNKHQPSADAPSRKRETSVATFQNVRVSLSKKKNKGGEPKVRAKDLKRQKKKKQQAAAEEEEEEETERKPFQQGDVAERRDFDQLLDYHPTTTSSSSSSSSRPLGAMGGAQLVPWVPPYLSEYLVVLADPRPLSTDLRQAVLYLQSNDSNNVVDLSQVVVIVADSARDTQAWLKRAGMDDEDKTPVRFLGDPKLEWMRRYSAVVDQERWSLSAYIFDTAGVIHKLARHVDPSTVSQLVTEMVESVVNQEE